MAAIGYLALVLALVFSLYSLIAYIVSARGRHQFLFSARNALVGSFIFVTASALVLLAALIFHDFKIEYVASYTSRDTSFIYLVSGLWAGNSGSLLFWAWLLSIFAVVVVSRNRNRDSELLPYASASLMFIQAFFLVLLLRVSNPFSQLAVVPADGRGLNPMLENPGMIIHPPLLLAGYVCFAVPFAFAIAALASNKLGNDWLAACRKWAVLSWLLLGVGNIIGAWWAYVELGWGGYWAWDPVENAGLMPWLVVTAFLHSNILQRRKGIFKVWNLVLMILTFNLAIFGTFLTRSGFLSSVHTFGENQLTPYFMGFLAITFFGSLGLLYYRRGELESEEAVASFVSRESTFLLNNIFLFGATLIIFAGTMFPGITEATRGVKIELGRAFFDRVNAPIFLAIILLIGICTVIGWRQSSAKGIVKKFLLPLAVAAVLTIVLLVLGVTSGYALIASFLCILVFCAILVQWLQETRGYQRTGGTGNFFSAGWRLLWSNRPRYGGYIVHISIIIMAIGVIGSSTGEIKQEASLKPGESIHVQNYTVVYDKIGLQELPDKMVLQADVSVYKAGTLLYKMVPEKIYHTRYEQPVSEVAIHSTLVEDVYVILAGWNEGVASFQVLVNPMVLWLWIGGGVFLLGGLLAFSTGSRRREPAEHAPGTEKKVVEESDEEIEREIQNLLERGERFCPGCGAKRQKSDRFCTRCGRALDTGSKEGAK